MMSSAEEAYARIKYEKSLLDNGVSVSTLRIPGSVSVSLGIWIKTGSRHEPQEWSGITHFLEHMLFKGTKRRSAAQISIEMDSVGGVINGFTTKEYTCFYTKTLPKDLDLAFDVLGDILIHSVFKKEELEREKNVVIQEICMLEDTPDEYVHQLFLQSYWKDNPLGRPILGSVQTVSSFDRERILKYHREILKPHNLIVTAAGMLDHDDVVTLAEKYFGHLEGRQADMKQATPSAFPAIAVHNKKLEQVHLCIGTTAPHMASKDIYAGIILDAILGGSMSSRLFQEIREKRGWAYSIHSSLSPFSDAGLLTIYAGVGKSTLQDVLKQIKEELYKIKVEKVDHNELLRAKEHIKGQRLLSSESSGYHMMKLGKNEIYLDRYMPEEEVLQKIGGVTEDDILDLASSIFRKEDLSITVLGEAEEKIPDDLFDL